MSLGVGSKSSLDGGVGGAPREPTLDGVWNRRVGVLGTADSVLGTAAVGSACACGDDEAKEAEEDSLLIAVGAPGAGT